MRAAFPPTDVEAYLHRHIPLSADMAVTVVACDGTGVILRAPLSPNINHRATVFGGSASAIAILAAWTWLHFALRAVDRAPRLVIQRNTVDYLAPIPMEFEARCGGLAPERFDKFVHTLDRHGRSRANLEAVLLCTGKKVAAFSGDYVAITVPAGA